MRDTLLWAERRNRPTTGTTETSLDRLRCSPSRARRNRIRLSDYLRNLDLKICLREVFDRAFIDRERCETVSTIDHQALDVVRGEVIRSPRYSRTFSL